MNQELNSEAIARAAIYARRRRAGFPWFTLFMDERAYYERLIAAAFADGFCTGHSRATGIPCDHPTE